MENQMNVIEYMDMMKNLNNEIKDRKYIENMIWQNIIECLGDNEKNLKICCNYLIDNYASYNEWLWILQCPEGSMSSDIWMPTWYKILREYIENNGECEDKEIKDFLKNLNFNKENYDSIRKYGFDGTDMVEKFNIINYIKILKDNKKSLSQSYYFVKFLNDNGLKNFYWTFIYQYNMNIEMIEKFKINHPDFWAFETIKKLEKN